MGAHLEAGFTQEGTLDGHAVLRALRNGNGARAADVDLREISLANEDLSGANLSRCDLSGADLSSAVLSGADLS